MSGNGNGLDFSAPRVDLVALDTAEGPEVKLPNGTEGRIRLFDEMHYQRYLDVQKSGNDEAAWELLTYALPFATPEEIGILSPVMMRFVTRAAARQADIMLEVLRKNAERPVPSQPAPADPSPPQRSTRKTKSSTRSRGSRAPSAQTGGP